MENSQKILQRSKNLRDKLNGFNRLKSDCEDLLTLIDLALEEKDESVIDEVNNGFRDVRTRFEKLRLETLLKGRV